MCPKSSTLAVLHLISSLRTHTLRYCTTRIPTHHLSLITTARPPFLAHTHPLASLHDTTTFHDKTRGYGIPISSLHIGPERAIFHETTHYVFFCISSISLIFIYLFLILFAIDLNRDTNKPNLPTYQPHHCTTRYACLFSLVLKMLSVSTIPRHELVTNTLVPCT
ncbi:hypothetical protein R3P38DRAFT_1215885 [Favolaschia claudopus]|uniref:Uncharacterized protein n=1 Tax=Favolaschia claudopus TaxID=2862362 RepID=A0AAW0B4K2_9AGAR